MDDHLRKIPDPFRLPVADIPPFRKLMDTLAVTGFGAYFAGVHQAAAGNAERVDEPKLVPPAEQCHVEADVVGPDIGVFVRASKEVSKVTDVVNFNFHFD